MQKNVRDGGRRARRCAHGLSAAGGGHVPRTGEVRQARAEPVLLRQDDVRPTGAVRGQLYRHRVVRAKESGGLHEPARRDRGKSISPLYRKSDLLCGYPRPVSLSMTLLSTRRGHGVRPTFRYLILSRIRCRC